MCRRESEISLADAAAAVKDNSAGAGQEDHASTRFSDHVAQPQSFARKFGHYKQHMSEGSPDGGSTTEDDSQRTGSYAGSSQHLADKDWQVILLTRYR